MVPKSIPHAALDYVLYAQLAILLSMTTFLSNLEEPFNPITRLYEMMEVALEGFARTAEADAECAAEGPIVKGPSKAKMLNTLVRKELDRKVEKVANLSAYRSNPVVAQQRTSTRRNKLIKRLKFNKIVPGTYGAYDPQHNGDADDAFDVDETADIEHLLDLQGEEETKKAVVPPAPKKKAKKIKVSVRDELSCSKCNQMYEGTHYCSFERDY